MELSNDSCAWTSDGYGWGSQVWDVWAGGLGVQVYLDLGQVSASWVLVQN